MYSQLVVLFFVLPDPNSANPDLPSFVTALREQLGLKLERARGLVDVVVIDSVERPTPRALPIWQENKLGTVEQQRAPGRVSGWRASAPRRR
jgi:hypothetical protein